MANQTITTDSNHDALTGRAAGENITVNSGAVLTIDSCLTSTAMGVLGDITVGDGQILIDGRSVKEVAYSSGTGSLPAIGDVVTGGTSSATGKVIEFISGTAASGVAVITVQSGTFTDGETITDTGTWSTTADTFVVGYLKVFGEDQDWSLNGFTTLQTRGDWYVLGSGDGTDSQTFTLPHSGQQCGAWVETASGSGVYERWLRTDEAFTDFGLGNLGRVFQQTLGSSTITFGTSTNGGRPASGANIRLPNVHLGTTTTGSPTTEVFSTPSANISLAQIQSVADLEFEYTNFSSIQCEFWASNTLSLTNCSMCRSDGDLATATLSAVVINNVILVQTNTYYANTYGLRIIDCVSLDIDNLDVGFQVGGSGQAGAVFETSTNIDINGMRVLGADPNHTYGSTDNTRFATCSTVTIDGYVSVRGEFDMQLGCSNFTIDSFSYSDNPVAQNATGNETNAVEISGGSNNITFDGISIIANGIAPEGYLFYFLDANTITLRNAGTVSAKEDCNSQSDGLVYLNGFCKDITFQRCFFDSLDGSYFGEFNPTSSGITFENCSVDYASRFNIDASDLVIKGCHGASGTFNSSTGMEIDFAACSGTHFVDVFTSDTQGRIHVIGTPPNVASATYVTATAGAPVFRRDGDLYIRAIGDQQTWTWPHQIKGHTGFQNLDVVTNGFNTGNWSVEYQIDGGTWTAATAANLNAETLDPAGFDFAVRATADSASSFNIVNGIYFATTTTLTDQSDNLYDISTPVTLTVTVKDSSDNSVIENARVYILTDGAGPAAADVEVFNAPTNASGQVTTSYGYTANQGLTGWVRKGAASPYYKNAPVVATIGSTGLELTVVMTPDE